MIYPGLSTVQVLYLPLSTLRRALSETERGGVFAKTAGEGERYMRVHVCLL